jgi:tetratricopeptide (TPR) repeat protein
VASISLAKLQKGTENRIFHRSSHVALEMLKMLRDCLKEPILPCAANRLFTTEKLIVVIASVLLTWGCAGNPAERKAKFFRSGREDFKKGKYQEAIIEFRNALQIDPRFADASYQLGLAYSAAGSREAAYRQFLNAVTLDPNNWDAHLELASALIFRRDYTGAERIALKVLQNVPGNGRAHEILAEKLTLSHDFAQAEAELRRSLELNPGKVETYAALGSVLRAAGKPIDAEAVFRKAVEVNPKSARARIAAGQFFFSQGKLSNAESELTAACELDARAAEPRLYLGRVLTADKKLSEAEKLFAGLKNLAPNNPQAYRALGIFYVSTGQADKAAAEFQSLLKSNSGDLTAKAYLVEVLVGLKRFKEAAVHNAEILEKNHDEPGALLADGRILVAQGRYGEAITSLQKFVQARPRSAEGFYLLGVAQKATGFLGLAKASFSQARILSPKSQAPATGLAELSLTRGDNDEALRQSGDALMLNPKSPNAQLASARALSGKGNNQQAEKQLAEILNRDPTALPALGTWVKISVQQGRTREAVDRILVLLRQDPRNAGLHFLLAIGYAGLKDLQRAEASVNQAISLNSQTPDAYALLASIQFSEGKEELGKQSLRTAIHQSPRVLSNYARLATRYEKDGDWGEATRLWSKAHDVAPDSAIAAAELAFLYLEHGGDVNLAIKLAQTAKQKMPDSPVTADCLGWAYYKLGSFKSAIQQLQISASKAPDNPMYQYHLGMAYLAAGQIALGERSLKVAIRQQPDFLDSGNARKALQTVAADWR